MNDMVRRQGGVRSSPEDQRGARGGAAGARARAAPPHSLPFHATGTSLFVRPGLGAPTGRALPRRPAPRFVLLMLVHFLTGVVAYPGRCNGQHANSKAFAVLDASGTIHSWGEWSSGGTGAAPTGSGFISIASNSGAFAALDSAGAISAWGSPNSGGSNAPTGSGFVSIASTGAAFAALDASGTISAWGSSIGVCQAVDRSRAAEYDAYCDDNCNYTPPNCDVSLCTQDCLDGR